MTIQGITPFLWFDREAEDAAKLYVSIFANSRITHVDHFLQHHRLDAGRRLRIGPRLDRVERVEIRRQRAELDPDRRLQRVARMRRPSAFTWPSLPTIQ